MARRSIKSINWAALAEKITESEKNMYATFKAESEQYLRRMMANPESAPKIDWAYYKKNIAVPGLVDKFQKEYEALTIPYPTDKYTAQIESLEKEKEVSIQKFVEDANKHINECNIAIEKVKSLLPFDQMTMDDVEFNVEENIRTMAFPFNDQQQEGEQGKAEEKTQGH